MTTKRLLPVAALSACGLAAAATVLNAVTPGLPADVDYTVGYAPWWVGLTGAVLGAAAVAAKPRPMTPEHSPGDDTAAPATVRDTGIATGQEPFHGDDAASRATSRGSAGTGRRQFHAYDVVSRATGTATGQRPSPGDPAATTSVDSGRAHGDEPAMVPLAHPPQWDDRPIDGEPAATGRRPGVDGGTRPSHTGGVAPRATSRGDGTAVGRRPSHGAVAPAAPPSPGGDAGTRPAAPRAFGAVGFAVGAAAAVVLLWASAGVVLDGFRAFFAVTGIPAGDFAVVDRLGFAARLLSLVACALVVAAVVRRRLDGDGCPACGRIPGERLGRVRPGVLALVLVWPYPLLKTYWWLGGGLARPTGFDEGLPAGELLAAVAGSLLFLAMTLAWWRRGGLRRLTLLAGWAAVAVLLSMGALSFFGTVAQLTGLTDGPVDFGSGVAMVMVGSVYGSWLALGVAVTVLTWRYQRSTRPVCAADRSR